MIPLEDIQNSAVDAKSELGTLLRKCKVLAARLGSQPLEDWLVWESNGYPTTVQVPEYRVWSLQVKGHFVGPFGSGMQNASVPLIYIPEEARNSYERYECRQSIANIESTLSTVKGGMIHVNTSDLAVALGTQVFDGQSCIKAWAEFSSTHFVAVLNIVRNRILDFSLALGKVEPHAGEAKGTPDQGYNASRITQIFNTTVFGGSANLVGSAHDSSISFHIIKNDFASLEKVLSENGIKSSDVIALRTALESDQAPDSPERFGPSVSSWIATMIEKAANGTWKIGLGVAGSLLAKAIAKYYGLE